MLTNCIMLGIIGCDDLRPLGSILNIIIRGTYMTQ